VQRDWIIAQDIWYESADHSYMVGKTEFIFQKLLLNSIEFVGRRILGSCAAALSYMTVPIGFTAKVIHLGVRQISNLVASTALAQQISQVWNNADLYGHAITSAPSQFYAFASSPLGWHLREDGTDRRAYIMHSGPNGRTVHQSEYDLFPFEVFEFTYKRIIGGTLTVGASVISPLGLVAKGVHLAARSAFAQ
ncbi:MAG: hypothetical protein ACHQUC_10860, partial [Chlamydiales bacterium]